MKVFLSAHWANLLNITYPVPPEKLEAIVPKGVDLEIRDGNAFVSLVAFDFLNTRVKGFKIPFHVDFPEVNLRYYVNYKGRRGVAFFREYVPKHCIAFIAQKLYNEPYVAFPMESETNREGDRINIRHQIWKKEDEFSMDFSASHQLSTPAENTDAHFFKEHELGFGVDHSGQTLFYRVRHPVWEVFDDLQYDLKVDFGKLYGPEWAFLNETTPTCALLAKGSNVKVFHPHKLEMLEEMEAVWREEEKKKAGESQP